MGILKKLFLVTAFVAAVIAAAYLAVGPEALEKKFVPLEKPHYADLEKKFGELTISYKSPLGYRVRYPKSYYAEELAFNQLHFTAGGTNYAESFSVVPVDGPVLEKDVKASLQGLDEVEITDVRRLAFGTGEGKLYDYVAKPFPGTADAFFIRQAAIPCADASTGQPYTALITAVIPAELAGDLSLADYIIYSFEC